MELVSKDQPKGNKALFVCPYHAWSYGTNGELMNVPFGEEGFANCDAVHVENRNLIVVPTRESAGLLFLVPAPAPGADTARLLREAMPPDLEAELGAFHLEKHNRAAEQTFRIDANWKPVHDTYCETYHVSTLHPLLSSQVACSFGGTCYYREFGQGSAAGAGGHWSGCMSAGRFTTNAMAKGVVEESRFEEPFPLHHLINLYMVAPNNVFICNSQNILLNQMWPGRQPGETTITISLHVPEKPAKRNLTQFKSLLDVVATEDFPCLPKMQKNFEANPQAELVFGRNEPALTDRQRYFKAAVEGRY